MRNEADIALTSS